jgi:Fic family protein
MINITRYIPLDKLSPALDEKVVKLMTRDAALNGSIPSALRVPMEHLLRNVNAYYSCKIEGNPTHPADLIRAQEMPRVEETEGIKEIKRLLEVEARLAQGVLAANRATDPNTLKCLHRDFYAGAPKELLLIENKKNGRAIELVPGAFRKDDVEVGKHLAPPHQEVEAMLARFDEYYRLGDGGVRASQAMLAAAASHHRLTYIHPFLDGNGRVARLFTDLYMRQAGLGGVGLWSMSRGFGRDTDAYYAALARADMPNQGAGDGRGILSDRGLMDFTEYFINAALDQVDYFTSLLHPQALNQRIDVYFDLRCKTEMIIDHGVKLPKLHPGTRTIYKQLLNCEEISRNEICEILGVEERTMHTIVKQMREAGLVQAPARKPLRLDLSPSSIEILFPRLWSV